MINKRGLTNIETVLSVVIFLAGIVVVVMLINSKFTEKMPSNTQLDKLEQVFRKDTKYNGEVLYFYTTEPIWESWSCDYSEILSHGESSPYIVYILKDNFEYMKTKCNLNENQYTFPSEIELYKYSKLDNFDYEGNFNIKITGAGPELILGPEPPLNVPVNAREIQIKILDDGEQPTMYDSKALLRVW